MRHAIEYREPLGSQSIVERNIDDAVLRKRGTVVRWQCRGSAAERTAVHKHHYRQPSAWTLLGGHPDVQRENVVAGNRYRRQVLFQPANVGGLRRGRPELCGVALAFPCLRWVRCGKASLAERRRRIRNSEKSVDGSVSLPAHRAARNRDDRIAVVSLAVRARI